MDDGPAHFLKAIILKYDILLLYPQSIPLIWISNSKFHFCSQSSMDSSSLPTSFSSLQSLQNHFLLLLFHRNFCFPCLSFECSFSKSPSRYFSSHYSCFFPVTHPPTCYNTQMAPADNYCRSCIRWSHNPAHLSPPFCW